MAELARKCEKNACKWLSVLLSCSLLIFVVAAWGGIYIFKFSSKIIFLTWLFAKNQSEFVKFSLISLRLMLCHQTIAHDLTQEWLPKFAKKSLQIIEFLSRYIWYKCFISKSNKWFITSLSYLSSSFDRCFNRFLICFICFALGVTWKIEIQIKSCKKLLNQKIISIWTYITRAKIS